MRQLITFTVADQCFGLDITTIREIRAYTPATRLPRVPAHVVGVVNLRGAVLPVIDLAQRVGWRAAQPTPRHVIIVARHEDQLCGFLVDSVSDIVSIADDDLHVPPADDAFSVSGLVEGLFTDEDRMVMLLALNNLVDNSVAIAA